MMMMMTMMACGMGSCRPLSVRKLLHKSTSHKLTSWCFRHQRITLFKYDILVSIQFLTQKHGANIQSGNKMNRPILSYLTCISHISSNCEHVSFMFCACVYLLILLISTFIQQLYRYPTWYYRNISISYVKILLGKATWVNNVSIDLNKLSITGFMKEK